MDRVGARRASPGITHLLACHLLFCPRTWPPLLGRKGFSRETARAAQTAVPRGGPSLPTLPLPLSLCILCILYGLYG